MRTYTEIFFGLQLFIAGYLFHNEYEWAKDNFHKALSIIRAFGYAMGVIPYVILVLIWLLIEWAYKKIDKKEVLLFYIKFYVFRKFSHLTNDVLKRINEGYEDTTSKYLKNAIRLINKRNKFTYSKTNHDTAGNI